jgi:pimeloyl-ACP methyl ester carboxylesterase
MAFDFPGKDIQWISLETPHPGEKMERIRNFSSLKYGYGGEADGLSMDELMVPIHVNGTEVVATCLHNPRWFKEGREIKQNSERKEDKIGVTWIHIGGTGGQAETHIGDTVVRLGEASRDSKVVINNMIILSSPLGAVRSGKGPEGFDEKDFRNSAEVLKKLLDSPEIKKSGKIVLSGLSAGGALALSLAEIMPEVEVVVLMDPAGMGKSRNITMKFVKDAIASIAGGLREGKSLGDSLEPVRKGWPAKGGMPENIFQFLATLSKSEDTKRLEKVYALDGETPGDTLRAPLLGADSTNEAREKLRSDLKLIISPAMGANVVNFLKQRAGWTKKEITTAIENPGSEIAKKIVRQADEILRLMFPNVNPENIHLLPWWQSTHVSVGSEQSYVDAVIQKVGGVVGK